MHMFEAKVERIRYMKDVPEELMEKALDEKAFDIGQVFGLEITPTQTGEKTLVEVRITGFDQVRLLKPGSTVYLEGDTDVFEFSESWENLDAEKEADDKVSECIMERNQPRPKPI